ncbi:MAG: MBOAT family O-acyltransferase, partial [Acidimicrobiales bacterium]
MLFPTTDFAIFLGVVFMGGWLLAKSPWRWKCFMVVASYVFYAWWDWRFVFLLAASTVINQAGALAVDRARRAGRERWRTRALVGTLVADLGLLGYFKYYGFFTVNVANA